MHWAESLVAARCTGRQAGRQASDQGWWLGVRWLGRPAARYAQMCTCVVVDRMST